MDPLYLLAREIDAIDWRGRNDQAVLIEMSRILGKHINNPEVTRSIEDTIGDYGNE